MSNNGDIYEQDDRVLLASRWICPECGCKIVECSAKEDIHEGYSREDRGRKCVSPGCTFKRVCPDDLGPIKNVVKHVYSW